MLTKGVPNVDNTKDVQTVLSFCSGYGGIERGLDLAGVEHRVLAYVEIEAFAIANLVSKMEDGTLDPAPIYTDLKTFPAHLFRGSVDLITGGYPCQPFSAAGKRMGKEDPRHLWPYISEHIEAIRPARVFFENVEGHISLGLREVLSDLEERGYNQTWGIFSASEVGARHQRKRVYIMGDSKHNGPSSAAVRGSTTATSIDNSQGEDAPCELEGASEPKGCGDIQGDERVENVAYSHGQRGRSGDSSRDHAEDARELCRSSWHDTGGVGIWDTEPRVGRVANGTAQRVERLQLLGNGVVPQTAAKAWEVLGG